MNTKILSMLSDHSIKYAVKYFVAVSGVFSNHRKTANATESPTQNIV